MSILRIPLHTRTFGSNLDGLVFLKGMPMNRPMGRFVIRRLAAMLLLGLTVSAQAAPLAAGAHCAMQGPLAPCCERAGTPSHGATVAAGSCCRFEAAVPKTQTPGILSQARHQDDSSPLLVLPPSSQLKGLASARSESHALQPRSTDSPLTLHNILRL